MLTDYKGRPLVPWVKLLTQTLEIIAEAAEPEEAHEAIKAAWIRYTTGQEADLKGIKRVIYSSLCNTIDNSADIAEVNRINGQKGGLAKASKAKRILAGLSEAKRGSTEAEADAEIDAEIEREAEAEADASAPSLHDLESTCKEGHINLSAADLKAIWAELNGQGWTFSGEPVRNLSKVLRWYERHPAEIRKARKPRRADAFQYEDQRTYDYDDLKRRLLNKGRGAT